MGSTFFGSGMAGDPISSLGTFLDELLQAAHSHPLLVQEVLLRLTVHEPWVSHLFPLLRQVLDRHPDEGVP